MSGQFSVRVSPHVFDGNTTSKIMFTVILALLPAAVAGAYFFGLKALDVILLSCGSAVFFEYACNKIMGRKVSLKDGSALLTGLLLALVLPPHAPYWVPIVGAFIAIAIAKQAFGGLGANIFNPALVGRAFLLASWPQVMTSWPSVLKVGSPAWMGVTDAVTGATPLSIVKGVDAVSAATSLSVLKTSSIFGELSASSISIYKGLFYGSVGGSLGETSAFLLLVGGLFLILKGIIDWRIPAGFIGTVFVFSLVFGENPFFHILAGGVIIGAFFMATDYVTSPTTKKGRMVFAMGCGLITMVIRFWGGAPEGVSFAILIMNAVTPLIDRHTRPRRFGT